jgi:hypothetical protein
MWCTAFVRASIRELILLFPSVYLFSVFHRSVPMPTTDSDTDGTPDTKPSFFPIGPPGPPIATAPIQTPPPIPSFPPGPPTDEPGTPPPFQIPPMPVATNPTGNPATVQSVAPSIDCTDDEGFRYKKKKKKNCAKKLIRNLKNRSNSFVLLHA